MALGNHHLLHLEPWYDRWLLPCFQAYYRGKQSEMAAAIATARAELADAGLSPDEHMALSHELTGLQYHCDTLDLPTTGHHEGVKRLMEAAVAQIKRAGPGPLSRSVQAHWLISFCGLGARRGYFDLSDEDYDELFARVAPNQRTQLFWFHVAIRAFHHNDLRYLELAAIAHSTEPTGFRDAYFFGCSRLMYRIVSGEATKRDVADFIRSFEHPYAVRDFKNTLLGRCIDSGIFDEQSAMLLDQATASLKFLEGTFPQPYRRRTLSMLENRSIYSPSADAAALPRAK